MTSGDRLTSGGQEVVRWFAIGCMVVDHAGAVLFPGVPELRVVGRLAWPLFAYLIAYNLAVRGVDVGRYVRPLLLWGLVSILPHWFALGSVELNILFTLLLGVLAIGLIERGGWFVALAVLPLALSGWVEYGLVGVLLPVAFWFAFRLRDSAAHFMRGAAVGVSNGLSAWSLFALPALVVPWLVRRFRLELPRVRRVGWLFYPAHLAALALVRWALSGSIL